MRAIHADPGVIARFWSHVEVGDSESGCWEWRGRVKPRGYPMLFIGHHSIAAARVSWFTVTGELPAGGKLHHVCDNTLCMRPSHLVWAIGRRTESVLDALGEGYLNRSDVAVALDAPRMPHVVRYASAPRDGVEVPQSSPVEHARSKPFA